jgi:ribose/xylose/arabinose/galactoside ABC-type transport system permease subunit
MQLINSIRQYRIFLAFLLICCFLSYASSQFLTVSNWTIIITQVSINALLAFGVTFVIITGGIDLSVGSIVAVAGLVAAFLASQQDMPLIITILGGLLAGLVFGLLNGLIITKSKIAPFIVTLGIMTMGRGLGFDFK